MSELWRFEDVAVKVNAVEYVVSGEADVGMEYAVGTERRVAVCHGATIREALADGRPAFAAVVNWLFCKNRPARYDLHVAICAAWLHGDGSMAPAHDMHEEAAGER